MEQIIQDLYQVIQERKNQPMEGSYTTYLFEKGVDKILKKVGEEATELIIASKNQEKEEVLYETCDLLYHVLVLLAEQEIPLEEIQKELIKRREKLANKKPERKPIENF